MPPNEFELLEFDIAYNDTHGLPLDLLESTLQILTGNVSRFWRIFMGLEIMPDWFGDKLILLSTALDRSALLTTDSLKKHIATYKNKIAEGKKVLLVAHSQGNLFGNGVFTLLDRDEQQSFGMVAVANVDNNVLGQSSPYTTLDSDKVVTALEQIDIMGVYGRLRFDPKTHQVIVAQDPKEGAVGSILQWQDGKRIVVYPKSIAKGSIELPPWMK